jgi:hypothetical protein
MGFQIGCEATSVQHVIRRHMQTYTHCAHDVAYKGNAPGMRAMFSGIFHNMLDILLKPFVLQLDNVHVGLCGTTRGNLSIPKCCEH